jgi:hypothetical protein
MRTDMLGSCSSRQLLLAALHLLRLSTDIYEYEDRYIGSHEE